MLSQLAFVALLFRNVALVNANNSHDNDDDGPPDFSSFAYPGSPMERSFKPAYDMCIVGGGTAGLVLADRLTESGRYNVVVFEAGGPPTDVRTYATPGGNQYALNGGWSTIDYNFMSVPQTNMNNRTFAYHRMKSTQNLRVRDRLT